MPAPSSSPPPLRLGVLISGGGTTLLNLQQLIAAGQLPATVSLVVASRDCTGIARSRQVGLEPVILARRDFPDSESHSQALFDLCRKHEIDLVVLAGYLTRIHIPDDFINRVMNIHPALIPAFCGQGMFGHHVHQAVLERGCKISGCTVHFCDNEYDHGPIILQQTVPVEDGDDAATLAARVFEAECIAYPEAIRLFAGNRLRVEGRRVFIDPPGESG